MPKPLDREKKDHTVKQLEQVQRMIAKLTAIVNDPNATQEAHDEAVQSLADQTAKLTRLGGAPTA